MMGDKANTKNHWADVSGLVLCALAAASQQRWRRSICSIRTLLCMALWITNKKSKRHEVSGINVKCSDVPSEAEPHICGTVMFCNFNTPYPMLDIDKRVWLVTSITQCVPHSLDALGSADSQHAHIETYCFVVLSLFPKRPAGASPASKRRDPYCPGILGCRWRLRSTGPGSRSQGPTAIRCQAPHLNAVESPSKFFDGRRSQKSNLDGDRSDPTGLSENCTRMCHAV